MGWFRRKPKVEPKVEPCETHGIAIKDPVHRVQHSMLDDIQARVMDKENPPTPEENAVMMATLVAMGPIGGKRCHHLARYPGCFGGCS